MALKIKQFNELEKAGIIRLSTLLNNTLSTFRRISMPEQLNLQPESQPKKWNVLLVDDEKFNHEILELFLAKTNFEFHSANNVRDAIEIISAAQTDIVITDAMMPNESGFSLIEKLKSNPQTAAIPVILWTVLEQPDGSVMDATKKADFTVCKPFYHSEILETLEKARQLAEANETCLKH